MADENKTAEEQNAAVASMMNEMVGTDGAPAAGAGDNLSQDEIDKLLGVGAAKEVPTRGVDAILHRSRDNYEKFPMLEVIFDRFSRAFTTSLRNFTGETVDISIVNITSIKYDDYINSIPLPAMISIFQAVEWENLGLISIDSTLIYCLIDILLGGGGKGVISIEGRQFTAIEQDIIKNFSRLILEEVTAAFAPITTVSFRMDRLEKNPKFAAVARPAGPVVIVSCRIEFNGIGGKIDIVLPYSTIEPVKALLTQMFSGDTFGSDVSWEGYLGDEIKTTKLKIRAELDKKSITLKELATLGVGSTIVMENRPDDDFKITCNGVNLFDGKLGSTEENVAISLTNIKVMDDLVR